MINIKKYRFFELDSTNSQAKRMASKEKEDILIIAERQTAGRGRMGRSFYSDEGGIYMSLLLHPSFSCEETNKITVMAAVAVSRAIEKTFSVSPEIKWVNDIFIGNKKVCGILTEGAFGKEKDKYDYAVLGIGINLFEPKGGFPEDIKDIAGAILKKDGNFDKEILIDTFLECFYDIYSGGGEYMKEYKARSNVLGRKIEYIKNGEIKKAEALDITDKGLLVVKDEVGISELSSGEIKIIVNSLK
ncbi:MAG: biotin--[acetyl-CoA-carboxylase] ligase [Clostridia bacterium]|nr:biotin--[acetyl-CoA-carboxylase] ligase [Clostridia bacterium]